MNPMKLSFRSLAGAAASAALVVCAAGALTAPVAVGAQATGGELTQAVGALRGISTLRADFVQTDRNGGQTRGVMTLKRPGRIRFQYEKGVPFLIVSDGKALTFVDYQVRQVQRWPISNSPLGALFDPDRDVAKYGKLIDTGNPGLVAVEVRDKAHPEYGVITLVFVRKASAPGGLELTSWAALDAQNNRTRVSLANHQYGLAVPDSTFRYNDPRRATRR
ncbi:outer membrane lipoprotein carrier protein LolA [Novosphingobium sp.]|uniref:LolA family protein n=1 Tax=Novosphingobium sp. TaxID=1874826 RepID=UPI00260D7A07|nr:outer membrane lipoprotein carrier protein LolA [Novosphingobium sp.]